MGATGSKLTPENLTALQESTRFDKREIITWHKSFQQEMPKGAAFITKEQLRSLYRSFFPFGDATRFADLLFRLFDANNQGRIGYSEYLIALSVASRAGAEEKTKWTFRFYDVDGDGLISRQDLTMVLQAAHEMVVGMVQIEEDVKTKVDKVFRVVNPKQPDRIEYDEFKHAYLEDPNLLQGLFIYNGLV